ncbi:MAG: hypothetical protein ABFS39_10830 [Pseudomonadota bacterium]
MNPVIQKHPEGCALACAAILAGKSYDEIDEIATRLEIFAGDKTLYNSTEPMRRLLAHLELSVTSGEADFTDWAALPDQALLATKWRLEDGLPHWHWVVFTRDEDRASILDPAAYLEQNRRTDFAHIEPKWFIGLIP